MCAYIYSDQIIASGLSSLRSVCLDTSGGLIKDIVSLSECLRASMLLPGMTGPVVHLPLWGAPSGESPSITSAENPSPVIGGVSPPPPPVRALPFSSSSTSGPLAQMLPLVASSALPRFSKEAPLSPVTEPLADALLFEAVPFRTAIRQGATHALVLRSRPDGAPVRRLGGLEAAVRRPLKTGRKTLLIIYIY